MSTSTSCHERMQKFLFIFAKSVGSETLRADNVEESGMAIINIVQMRK